jgi:hypothetical protein
MKYKMYLNIGDWSDDGHGKWEKILLESNLPVEDVQQAYKDSCKLTGVSFNHSENYTGVKRDWQEQRKYEICTEYEESSIQPETLEILLKFGFAEAFLNSEDCFNDDWKELYEKGESVYLGDCGLPSDFYEIWVWFVKLSNSKLELKRIDTSNNIPNINGFWNENLNVQFGYGLFL